MSNHLQRDLPMLAEARRIADVPAEFVRSCSSELEQQIAQLRRAA